MNYLPEKLQKYRKHYKYSQDFLAKTLGIDVVDYMGIENGRLMINYDQMLKLSKLYRVPVDEIFRNDPNVTLRKHNDTTTDQLNIDYFMRQKKLSYRLFKHLKKRWYYYAIALVLIISFAFLIIHLNKPVEKPLVFYLGEKDKLDVSNTSVVYIDSRGAVKGRGDNANTQLSDLPSADILKVCEGEAYTVVLKKDGTVSCFGTFKYSYELGTIKDIINIASGNSHVALLDKNGVVYAFGDNLFGECDVSSFSNIKDIYAFGNCTVAIEEDGDVLTTGSIFGTSMLSLYRNLVDIDASENIIVALQENGKVAYTAKNDRYSKVLSWTDIVDVTCGDEFIAGLRKDGKVMIAIDNSAIIESVENWPNIKAIAAGKDYLIGYDGEKIKGVGNNAYLQFESESHTKIVLPSVSNISVSLTYDTVIVQFNPVDHASGYRVSLNVGIGMSYDVTDPIVTFDSTNLKEGITYIIDVITLGNEEYANSNPNKYYLVFHRPEKEKFELNLDEYIGKTKTELLDYLQELGITNIVEEINEKIICDEDEIVLDINYKKGKYYIDEKDTIEVKYTCCVLTESENEE